MCCHGEEGHHPDYEEVVGDEGGGFEEPDGLDADSDEDLLIGVGGEEFTPEEGGGWVAFGGEGGED